MDKNKLFENLKFGLGQLIAMVIISVCILVYGYYDNALSFLLVFVSIFSLMDFNKFLKKKDE